MEKTTINKLKNRFIVIVPVYNAELFIKDTLMSIINQDYHDVGIIIRNDMSTDNTYSEIEVLLSSIQTDKNIISINNTSKLYAGGNIYESVMNYVDNDNAIIGIVDGDDLLHDTQAISKIVNIYDNNDVWLVWSKYNTTSGAPTCCRSLPYDSVIYRTRNYWCVSHFRTNHIKLFHKIDRNDLIDKSTNNYFKCCGDAAYLYPMIEMSGNKHSYFLNESLYTYRDNYSNNDHHANFYEAVRIGTFIKECGRRYNFIKSL